MSKKVIIYFSYSGNTEKIANYMQKKLNCPIVALKPTIPFSSDYQSVVDEYQNNSIDTKEIAIDKIDINLDDYAEIILGTPVWWYTITPPITTFLKNNNLQEKTIYPFATNAGWLGHTFEDIKKLCPNSKIQNELNIVFSTDHNSHELITNPSEIDAWLEKI